MRLVILVEIAEDALRVPFRRVAFPEATARRKLLRCQAITVSGLTMMRADRQSFHTLHVQAQRSRPGGVSLGRFTGLELFPHRVGRPTRPTRAAKRWSERRPSSIGSSMRYGM